MPLTDTYIRNAKPTGKPKKHFDGGGLFSLRHRQRQQALAHGLPF